MTTLGVTKGATKQEFYLEKGDYTKVTNVSKTLANVILETSKTTGRDTTFFVASQVLNTIKDHTREAELGQEVLLSDSRQGKLELLRKDQVSVEFKEDHFSKLAKRIEELTLNYNELEKAVTTQTSDITGAAKVLSPSAHNYEEQKSRGIALLQKYPILFNQGITTLAAIAERKEKIAQLKKLTLGTIEDFSKKNSNQIAYFTELFSDITYQHQLLDESLNPPATSNIWGSALTKVGISSARNVKIPNPKNTDQRYKEKMKVAQTFDLDQTILVAKEGQTKYSETNFSTLFKENNTFLNEMLVFGKEVRKHSGKIMQAKHCLISADPEYNLRREEAANLPKTYEPIHDRCQEAYESLQKFNQELEGLKIKFSNYLDKMTADLVRNENQLVEHFTSYAGESKSLDYKIGPKMEHTQNLRTLTLKSTLADKYEQK